MDLYIVTMKQREFIRKKDLKIEKNTLPRRMVAAFLTMLKKYGKYVIRIVLTNFSYYMSEEVERELNLNK